ncbi:MAG TPA: hypothetical protein VMV19_15755 [Xanthobacteraceae bacterium]|nr:hypothetical protein [Xanthobacteraceae bacterium]
MSDQRSSAHASPPSKPPIVWLWSWCVAKIKRTFHERRTKKENESSQDRSSRRTATATVWIAIFAVVAAIVGVSQAIVGNRQLIAMQGQLDTMAADQRPWIKPVFQIIGLKFTDSGDAEITYLSNFKNVGKSPAQNIKSRIVVTVMTKKTAIQSVNEEMEQCRLAAKDSASVEGIMPGIFLFPGEEAPELIGGRGAGRAYVSTAEFSKGWPAPKSLVFKLIGCFDYLFSKESRRRGQTGFAYIISRKATDGSGHLMGFLPSIGDIPIDQIFFAPDPFSGGFIN